MHQERYNRQLILKGFGESAQVKLKEARILVIGAGGLGCPALQYLAAAGVGYIGIADDDVVSLSNLHRQILYTTEDVGKVKVEVAVKRLRKMNTEITVFYHAVSLKTHNILEVLKAYDFVLDGTDNFESRYLINDACALLKKPLIFAAVSGYEGQLAVFNTKDEINNITNYRDLFPVSPNLGEIPNCSEQGVLGVLPGIIGSLAAAEAIKLMTGIGRPLINKILHYNLLSGKQYEINIAHGNDYLLPQTPEELLAMHYENSCVLTGDHKDIDLLEMQNIMQQGSTLVIDVRERHEMPWLDDKIYRQVPMSEFESFLTTEIAEPNLILLCQHGIRSIAAAEKLQVKYGPSKNIYSLKGGIVKWRNHF
jgi:molybdopterin/thiamine biosynthesis adenylyltransferase/rhodanese-related sulfurtransferase